MDAFLLKFVGVLFKVFVVSFVLLLITGTSRRLLIKKTIKALIELPNEKRKKLILLYQKQISLWKLVFWTAPLYLLVIPILLLVIPVFFASINSDFMDQFFPVYMTGIIGLYIYTLDDFFYKKKILKAIGKSPEIEMTQPPAPSLDGKGSE